MSGRVGAARVAAGPHGRRAAICARAPLRIGLAGGGTDLSPYCERFGGAVLNSTIDLYAHASIAASGDGGLHFEAPDIGLAEHFFADMNCLEGSALLLHKGVTRRMLGQFAGGRVAPIRVTGRVDAPPGSGLGSSSALVVALVAAFGAWLGVSLTRLDVARIAWEVERRELGLAGGRQDQYAAALGGTNFLEFHAGERVVVAPVDWSAAARRAVEESLLLCFTGVSRRSEAIIAAQQRGMAQSGEALRALHALKRDAVAMRAAVLAGEIEAVAAILGHSWRAKRRTAAEIGTPRIEWLLSIAEASGALSGKVSGAGGGGFLMLVVPPGRRDDVARALAAAGAPCRPVVLTDGGVESWWA